MNNTKGNGLTADNSQPAETYKQDTNDLNFATGTRRIKAIATQIEGFEKRGLAVHRLEDGGFSVFKYEQVFHANDFEELQAFASRLEVKSWAP